MNKLEEEKMSQQLSKLRLIGRVVAVGFAAFFTIGILSNLTGNSVHPESSLGRLVRWGHGGEPQEVMLGAVYLAIAIYLWKAVADPRQHWIHIDFALVANVLHSIAMVVLSLLWPDSIQHLWGDSLFTIVPTAMLAYAWLPVRRRLFSPQAMAPV